MISEDLKTTYQTLSLSVAEAMSEAGRNLSDVTMIAVSKTQVFEKLDCLAGLGQKDFGENKVQEAMAKLPQLRDRHQNLCFHLIGHLQSNKAKDAVALFDVIHTLDSLKLAEIIANECSKQNKKISCFIQINTGDEAQKGGISPLNAADMLKTIRDDYNLNIMGLMCLPPVSEPAAFHFALLSDMARDLNLPCLSMGMSHDYKDAILFGATHIRLGTALFGERVL
jgi:hypothetical protein